MKSPSMFGSNTRSAVIHVCHTYLVGLYRRGRLKLERIFNVGADQPTDDDEHWQ